MARPMETTVLFERQDGAWTLKGEYLDYDNPGITAEPDGLGETSQFDWMWKLMMSKFESDEVEELGGTYHFLELYPSGIMVLFMYENGVFWVVGDNSVEE